LVPPTARYVLRKYSTSEPSGGSPHARPIIIVQLIIHQARSTTLNRLRVLARHTSTLSSQNGTILRTVQLQQDTATPSSRSHLYPTTTTTYRTHQTNHR